MDLDARLGPGFTPTLQALSSTLGIDPAGAVQVMLFESGLSPSILRADNGAVGLNQLLPMNYGVFAPLTLAQYRGLTATQQLPYVFKFWRGVLAGKGPGPFSARDLYWLNILPASFVPNAPDSHVVMRSGDPFYSANRAALDFGNKGFITAGDFATAVAAGTKRNPELWAAILSQLNTAPAASSIGELVAIVATGLAIGASAFAVYNTRPRRAYA